MKRWLPFFLCIVLLSGYACIHRKVALVQVQKTHEGYDSQFPSGVVSDGIAAATRAVKKIYSISSYTTWKFRREQAITRFDILTGNYKKTAWGIISTKETVFGTAVVAGVTGKRIALLTCAHVINSPDTLVSYFPPQGDDPAPCIQSFSVKEKQENWVKDLPACGSFTVLASDIPNDIAILGKDCESLMDTVTMFPFPAGRANDLGWGCFVYILGYPLGNLMVTSGIVSPLSKRPKGEFSVDALLNKGCSGGVILAIRNGVPNFELVGLVKNVGSDREEFLKPAADRSPGIDWMPYKGEMNVGTREVVQYGLNAVVPIEAIVDFYRNSRVSLITTGYNLDGFFAGAK
ncbi:MAG: serine protease [Bacteroidota bacterium]